ncbi:MAG: hypothetical protein E4H00_09950, partial [Myxococcales bacterium]
MLVLAVIVAALNVRAGVFSGVRFQNLEDIPLSVGDDAGLQSVALADVDGDDALDLIAINRLDDVVSVLLGEGDGEFGEPNT